jgi:hypothetical protein
MENPLQRIAHLLTRHIRDDSGSVIDTVYKEIAAMHDSCPYRRVGCAIERLVNHEKERDHGQNSSNY